jgi:hypothetical protein
MGQPFHTYEAPAYQEAHDSCERNRVFVIFGGLGYGATLKAFTAPRDGNRRR